MTEEQWDDLFGTVGMLKVVGSNSQDGMRGSIPFQLGDVMTTMGDDEVPSYKVVCMELSNLKGYECSKWSDNKWRYNREHDRGRSTGSSWKSPHNIIPKFPEGFVRK